MEEAVARPSGKHIPKQQRRAMDINQHPPVPRRRDLVHPNRYRRQDHERSCAAEKTEHDEHRHIDTAGQQRSRDQRNQRRYSDSSATTPFIREPGDSEHTQEPADLVNAVHGANESGRVRAGVEVEVREEAGLRERGGDYGGAVAVGHTAEGHGDDGKEVDPVELAGAGGVFVDVGGGHGCGRVQRITQWEGGE